MAAICIAIDPNSKRHAMHTACRDMIYFFFHPSVPHSSSCFCFKYLLSVAISGCGTTCCYCMIMTACLTKQIFNFNPFLAKTEFVNGKVVLSHPINNRCNMKIRTNTYMGTYILCALHLPNLLVPVMQRANLQGFNMVCMWLSAIVPLVCCRFWLSHHAGEALPKFTIDTIMFVCCRRGYCKDHSPPSSTHHFAGQQGKASYTPLSISCSYIT